MPNIIKEKGVIMAKKKKEQGESSVNENEDSKQDKLIMELLDELPLIRTENYVGVQIVLNGKKEFVPIDDDKVFGYLVHELKDRYGIWAKTNAIKNCITYKKFEGYDKELTELKLRIAYHDDSIIYDLCDGKCVVVNKYGWEVKENDYTFFKHYSDQKEQITPIPCKDGWKRIEKYLNIPEEDKILVIAYIVACFNPQYTFPSISINGGYRTGKSTITNLIKDIIDPSTSSSEMLLNSFDDLKVRLNSCYYVAFDNLSKISNSMSNFFCTVINGTTLTTRKKFENDTPFIITLKRGMCLNGIGNFIINPDLVDRMLFINTKPFSKDSRIGEKKIELNQAEDMPYILGSIFELLSKALGTVDSVKISEPFRLIDFHRFCYAIAEAMGGYGEDFNNAIKRNKDRQNEIVYENFEIVRIIEDFLIENDYEWSSSVEMLYKSIKGFVELDDENKYNLKAIPKAPNAFSRLLTFHESDLAERGFRFEKKKNGKGVKEITFYYDKKIIRTPIIGIRKPVILSVDNTNITAELLNKFFDDEDN